MHFKILEIKYEFKILKLIKRSHRTPDYDIFIVQCITLIPSVKSTYHFIIEKSCNHLIYYIYFLNIINIKFTLIIN